MPARALAFERRLTFFITIYKKIMNIYKIAVIGGTGKSGKYLVNELVNRGKHVKLLLRTNSSLENPDPLIEVVRGDVRDYQVVEQLLDGCSAVISTLGQPANEPTIFSQATRNIVEAMHVKQIRRYLVTTGLSVDAPGDRKNPQVQLATNWMYEHFPETTRDKQVELDFLLKCEVDWTLVRLPLIIQTDERFPLCVNLDDCPGERISAVDLAHFLADQVEDVTYIRQSPFLANNQV